MAHYGPVEVLRPPVGRPPDDEATQVTEEDTTSSKIGPAEREFGADCLMTLSIARPTTTRVSRSNEKCPLLVVNS